MVGVGLESLVGVAQIQDSAVQNSVLCRTGYDSFGREQTIQSPSSVELSILDEEISYSDLRDIGRDLRVQRGVTGIIRALRLANIRTYGELLCYCKSERDEIPAKVSDITVRNIGLRGVGVSALTVLYRSLYSIGIDVFENEYTQAELGIPLVYVRMVPPEQILETRLDFGALTESARRFSYSPRILAKRLLTVLAQADIKTYGDLQRYAAELDLDSPTNDNVIRLLPLSGFNKNSARILYSHLNSLERELFDTPYTSVELN